MKFILFVEGHTEHQVVAAFLKRWLDDHLLEAVGIQTVRFDGWAEMVREMPKRAKMYLNAPKGDVIAVIALLDLYGFQLSFPAACNSVLERIEWATEQLEHAVGEGQFRQFFAVHETEAWLLCEPRLFPALVAKSLQGKAEKPETVNHKEPPAKLLDRLYMRNTGHGYKKVIAARNLFPKLNPDVAYTKCPQLKILLDTMLFLATHR